MGKHICHDCHAEFVLGRGRPPKLPLCAECKQYGDFRNEEVKQYLTDKKIEFDKPKRAPTPKKLDVTVRKISADLVDEPSVKSPRMTLEDALLPEEPERAKIHGATASAVTRPCPKCGYAYADGGYCNECGWSKPIDRMPYGSASGKIGKS
jgi:hypothetical protein